MDPDDDIRDEGYVPTNAQDQYNHNLCKRFRFLCTEYDVFAYEIADEDPEQFRGAPVSLQLVGRRYEDEKVRCPHQSQTEVWLES